MTQEVVVTQVTLPGASWQLNLAEHREVFPKSALDQAQDLLKRWIAIFPRGNTWVGFTHKVPSLIVRLDCVLDDAGKLQVFEVEDRPCGIGVASHTVPEFKERLNALREEWPAFNWVRAPNRETDDALWLGEGLTLDQAKLTDGLLLVRSRPEDREFHAFEPRAVSTVQHEGNKRCCADPSISMYSIIRWVDDPEEQSGGYIDGLPGGPFMVKPSQGTRAREVRVYLNGGAPAGIKVAKKDKLSFGDLERWVRTNRVAVCQPLIPPMQRDFLPGMNMIYRFFFGYSPKEGGYVPLGGVWMALDALVVHGTDKSISGPLVCAD